MSRDNYCRYSRVGWYFICRRVRWVWWINKWRDRSYRKAGNRKWNRCNQSNFR